MSENVHDPTPTNDCEAAPGYYELMETAVRELLVEKQLIGPGEIRRQIEVLDSRTPALGAKVVARAWKDAAFRGSVYWLMDAQHVRRWASHSTTIRSSSF